MEANADRISPFIQMATGYWVSQMIHVAAELALADHLAAAGPTGLSAEELAARCDADADALTRLLRGLASVGLFAEDTPRRFVLTPLAELLRSDVAGSQRQVARMLGGEHYDAWSNLLHSVRTGESAFRHRFGEGIFGWYGRNPERGAIFDGAMSDFSHVAIQGLLAAYDFGGISHQIDVGDLSRVNQVELPSTRLSFDKMTLTKQTDNFYEVQRNETSLSVPARMKFKNLT